MRNPVVPMLLDSGSCQTPSAAATDRAVGSPLVHGHTIDSAISVTPNMEWRLLDNDEATNIRPDALILKIANDSAVAAAAGFGLTRSLSHQVAEHLQSSTLKLVLPEFEPAALPVHVQHRAGREAPQRARAFLELAVERMREDARLN